MAVVGGGPAGWSTATSFAQRGFKTVLVAPKPYAEWPNNYGAWADELVDWPGVAERTWPRAEVRLDDERVHVLERPYVRVDTLRLQAALRSRAEAAGLHVVSDAVTEVAFDDERSTLGLTAGGPLKAVLVVDASGHRPKLTRMGRGRDPGVQVAYGVKCVLEEGVMPEDRMVLMDFRAGHLPIGEREPPTFLYAMPLGDGAVFIEETSLVARPPLDIKVCQRRLDVRVASLGWRVGPPQEVEHCFIPMGGPQPPRNQRVVPVGGAAAAVHPATGYMLANVLRMGPRIAEAVWSVRDRVNAGEGAQAWSDAGWDAVWSSDRRRAWSLYKYGMEVLVNMDVSSTAGFFDAFFQLPRHHWQGYLSGDVSSREVAAAMWSLFGNAGLTLKWQLMSKGFSALMR